MEEPKYEDLKKALIEAMAGCCMLQFERNLIRDVRKEQLDAALDKTSKEIQTISNLWIQEMFKDTGVDGFGQFLLSTILDLVKKEVDKSFRDAVYQLYINEEDIVSIAKKQGIFFNANKENHV